VFLSVFFLAASSTIYFFDFFCLIFYQNSKQNYVPRVKNERFEMFEIPYSSLACARARLEGFVLLVD